jgi:hypothetical protein
MVHMNMIGKMTIFVLLKSKAQTLGLQNTTNSSMLQEDIHVFHNHIFIAPERIIATNIKNHSGKL